MAHPLLGPRYRECVAAVRAQMDVGSADKWSSVTTVVKGTWLASLFNKYKTDLLSANLRGYLGSRESDSNINNGIKVTARDEPENFPVYNNGITALVLDFKVGNRTKKGRTPGEGTQAVVPTFVGIFASIASVQKEAFEKFAKLVRV